MTTLRDARDKGEREKFIAEREAEGQVAGDAAKRTDPARQLAETAKSVRRTLKQAGSGD